MKPGLHNLDRLELLERLAYWNGRLEALGTAALISPEQARDLDTSRLRKVVDATIGHTVDLLDAQHS